MDTWITFFIIFIPAMLTYLLSFVNLGIYWNNHHHMLQLITRVNGSILCANMHLLFWLSLIPVGTAWMGETHFARWPVVLYGVDLLACSIAWYVLSRLLIRVHGPRSVLATAYGRDFKGKLSSAVYVVAVALAFFEPWIAVALYGLVALMWLVPDRRIERILKGTDGRAL